MALGVGGLSAFYSWRLIYKTFHGQPHDEAHYEAAHESPPTMLVPLFVLALGCVLAGFPFLGIFAGSGVEGFFGEPLPVGGSNTILGEMEHFRLAIPPLPRVLSFFGWGGGGRLLSW